MPQFLKKNQKQSFLIFTHSEQLKRVSAGSELSVTNLVSVKTNQVMIYLSLLSFLALGASLTNALSVHDLPEIPAVRHLIIKCLNNQAKLEWRSLGDAGGWQQWLVQLSTPGRRVPRLPDRARAWSS